MSTQTLLIACLLGANNYNEIGKSLKNAVFIALTAFTILIMTFLCHKIAIFNVSNILKVLERLLYHKYILLFTLEVYTFFQQGQKYINILFSCTNGAY